MDGVLVDSASLHLRAYEQVFAQAGLSFTEEARTAVRNGKSRSNVLSIALPDAQPSLRSELGDAKPEALRALLEDHGDCSMPGAIETVRALEHAGVPMAVVTNSRTPEIWLAKLGISNQISVVISGNDVSIPKPAAEGYLCGAARLGVVPDRCLALEDSRDGWMAARSAGMRVAVVAKERPAWLDAETVRLSELDPIQILHLAGLSSAARP